MTNSPARVALDVGSVIADTYKIEALLGRGGMGAVFLASHLRLAGKHVAIKILHSEIADSEVMARFRREAEIAAKLNHPNIVGVVDYNVAPDGTPYLVLDYLEGETLADRLARGPLALDHVLSIVRQIGSALAAAHRAGIVHRDLKPQNIFLVPTEVDGRMVEITKVLDFGISKIRGSQTVKTQDSAMLGTPQYMAPEQATGQQAQVDERTDVFALGAIVYEMLTGEPAFSGASIPEVVFKVVYEHPVPLTDRLPALPLPVAGAVARAMAKSSAERFQNVTTFAEAITGQPLTLSRASVPGAPSAPAAADSPSAARRVATGEAYAQTMGSGDHGESTVDPRPSALFATAAPAAALPTPPTGSAHAAVPTRDLRSGHDAAPGRSIGRIAAIAVAVAALGAAVVVLATRDRGSHRGHPRDEHGAVATADPSAPPPGPGPAPADTGHASAPPSGSGAASKPPEPPSPAPPPPAPPTEHAAAPSDPAPVPAPAHPTAPPQHTTTTPHPVHGEHATTPRPGPHSAPSVPEVDNDAEASKEGDEETRQKLAQATAALSRGEYETAEQLANAVLNGPSTPKQRAAAHVIHGSVQCAAHNDQEGAQIDLRRLENFRVLRARLIAYCRKHGIEAH